MTHNYDLGHSCQLGSRIYWLTTSQPKDRGKLKMNGQKLIFTSLNRSGMTVNEPPGMINLVKCMAAQI